MNLWGLKLSIILKKIKGFGGSRHLIIGWRMGLFGWEVMIRNLKKNYGYYYKNIIGRGYGLVGRAYVIKITIAYFTSSAWVRWFQDSPPWDIQRILRLVYNLEFILILVPQNVPIYGRPRQMPSMPNGKTGPVLLLFIINHLIGCNFLTDAS